MTARWELYLRNRTFSRQATLDTYEFSATLRFNEASTWTLTAPADIADLDEFAAEDGDASAGGGIILLRDGVVMLSGPIDNVIRTPDEITLQGRDDSACLADNEALPVTVASGDYSLAENEVRGPAVAETLIRQFVEFNIGPTAERVEMRSAGLQDCLGPDQGQGLVVTGSARFTNLLSLVAELAQEGGGLRVWVEQTDIQIGGRTLRVASPTDKTRDVVFSEEIGNLETYSDMRKAPKYNHLIGAGVGHAKDRLYAERADQESVGRYGRRVGFLDARTVDDANDLSDKLDAALAAQASRRATTVQVLDTEGTAYGPDYSLGDLVAVVVNGVAVTGVVRTVAIKIDAAGVLITPTIGTPGASPDDPDDAVRRQIEAVLSRLSNVEANTVGTGSLTASLFGSGSVTSGALGAGSVTTAKIVDGQVTTAKIATDAVTTIKIANDAIDSTKIATSAVGTSEIADGSVTDTELASNSVTTVKINNGAVTAAKIAAGVLTVVPVGASTIWATATPPTGWLIAAGQTVSRTTYAALFAVLGTTWNTGGEAGSDFRLPNLEPIANSHRAGSTVVIYANA